jgi:hypothetical protein
VRPTRSSARFSRPQPSRSATTSRRRAPRGRVHRVPPPRRSHVRRSAAFIAFFHHVALRVPVGRCPCARRRRLSRRAVVAAGAQRTPSAPSRRATWLRDPCKRPRVSQLPGLQRLGRHHGPRGSPPRGSRGVTAGWPARAVAGRISARDVVEGRKERGRGDRWQRRRGGTRGSPPRGTRARGRGARTSHRVGLLILSTQWDHSSGIS